MQQPEVEISESQEIVNLEEISIDEVIEELLENKNNPRYDSPRGGGNHPRP